ncbi:MAG: hypothetical protein WAW86_05605 [Gammaproteobacteria bacterium]
MSKISLANARAYLAQLDLDYIVKAMCSADYALPQWTEEDAKHCARLYKNFLFLFKKHFPEPLVPTRLIDEFWHNHILYTKRYTEDCLNIFGHYLHHEPASGDEGAERLVEQFMKTQRYYFEEFGELYSISPNIT